MQEAEYKKLCDRAAAAVHAEDSDIPDDRAETLQRVVTELAAMEVGGPFLVPAGCRLSQEEKQMVSALRAFKARCKPSAVLKWVTSPDPTTQWRDPQDVSGAD